MRPVAASFALCLLLAGGAAAQEDAGVHRDPAWALTLRAPGLRRGFRLGTANQLFAGACDGGVQVEILVAESTGERAAAAWIDTKVEEWEGRGTFDVAVARDAAPPRVLLSRRGVGGSVRRHAYSFHVRGLHLFLVHAVSAQGDDGALTAALGDLTLGTDPGMCLEAQRLARTRGARPQDAVLRAEAGMRYLRAKPPNVPLGARVLRGVLRSADAGDLDTETRASLLSRVGVALLEARRLDDATEWLKRAESAAAETGAVNAGARAANAAYNLACAHALAGRIDDAFAALERCAAKGDWAAYWKHAQGDPDVEALRADRRWQDLAPGDE